MIDAINATFGPHAAAYLALAFGVCGLMIVIAWIADRRER